MTFGERLQALRQRAGMSQDALAERLGVSRQAVSRWERDETMPETDKVIALADLFGVTTDYLLRPRPEETEQKAQMPPREKTDWMERFLTFAKRKWYLLGWVLIVWGGIDLARGIFIKVAFQGTLGAGQSKATQRKSGRPRKSDAKYEELARQNEELRKQVDMLREQLAKLTENNAG